MAQVLLFVGANDDGQRVVQALDPVTHQIVEFSSFLPDNVNREGPPFV